LFTRGKAACFYRGIVKTIIMAVKIHSKAVVAKSAKLADKVKVGPFAVIGENVKIAAGTVIEAGAQVIGNTQVGKNCHIFPYAIIGSISQDLKYAGVKSYLVIGDNNTIREFVTINTGTEDGSQTVVGDGNHIMAYSHIAHDCAIGNENVFANCATLAGYVRVGDKSVIGGLAAVHQFCRVGSYAIVGGCSKVVQDIPPFSMCDGHPAVVCGLNAIGLKRAKFSNETVNDLKKAFKILFFENHTFAAASELVKEKVAQSSEVDQLIKFIASSKRGISK